MKSLDTIAIERGTDKSSKGHNYCNYYELFFDALRYKTINLLEIGIDKGDSLLMWNEFFPHSEIHGIDLRGDYKYLNDLGIKTHICDHSNELDLTLFGENYKDYFDILIEDGSHEAEDSILSFNILFPYLKSGGFYCIEDCLCSLDKTRWGKNANVYDRAKQMIDEVNMSGNISNENLSSNKFEAIKKYSGSYFDNNIEYVFNSCGLIIIKKI